MSFITGIWNGFLDIVGQALTFLHDALVGLPIVGGEAAWGWAIIGLTLIVRVLLLPLAAKQIRSMRGMQAIQPKVKEIQEKYKVDRDLMKKDPERYQKLKTKQNEKLMALYKEEGVNPASSCLPLLLQMPIFFALFRVLGDDSVEGLAEAPFYFFTSFIEEGAQFDGLGAAISNAGWPGFLLIGLMAGTMFLTQRQMMSRNSAEGAQATQQKIMMYVFPGFLAVISFGFPLAVVLYWVTTNIWQFGQQYVMYRSVADEEQPPEPGTGKRHADRQAEAPTSSSTNSDNGSGPNGKPTPKADTKPSKKPAAKNEQQSGKKKASSGGSHLPTRRN